jgi:pyruvate,orthophosphate dikinase
MEKKYVYLFNEGDANMRELLGGKGANLAEMSKLGMPVPNGFTITTEACNQYYADGETISDEIKGQIMEYLEKLENETGKKFSDADNPLLVSVRSGARASMPGMMDTILNLGINDEVAAAMAEKSQNPRFVYDSYRRFIQMFSDVVKGLSKKRFEEIIDELKAEKGITNDLDLDAEDMKELVKRFKAFYKQEMGEEFPTDPKEQMMESIEAVFRSWNNERAIYYRRQNDIPSDWGTAVNVQMMVFGNMGNSCGTGVAFTRNPATGENKLYGEFLMNAQGEDVVAGVRTPNKIEQLQEISPEAFEQFKKICETLEKHYKNMQDMEFTIENGKLYMLQTRNGKRTAQAALKVATDMVDEGLVNTDEALMMVKPNQLDALLHPMFDAESLKEAEVLTTALPASPGAACGQVVFSAEEAIEEAANGKQVVLVRLETSPEDIQGMAAAEGILTVRGGMTSHAAVVARGMGACCVSGAGDITMDDANGQFTVNGETIKRGDWISLDGSTGKVYKGKVKTVPAEISGDFDRFMKWADERRRLKIRTNADTPRDARQAVAFGAEGIGLTRTEHMFFDGDKIKSIREMILAQTPEQMEAALAKIEPLQQEDFEGIYEAMEGRPVTIRYLDPPLHEFLPHKEEEIKELADEMGISTEDLQAVADSLHEVNPMMGHRGSRLAVSYPGIARTQTEAVIKAALNVNAKHPEYNIEPEIMLPLIGDLKELKYVKKIVTETADKILEEAGSDMKYHVGTMIEVPRAALKAGELAEEAEFFSFGTNDLTQLTFGFSRDDAGNFLPEYYAAKIYENDPFAKLDQEGVGELIEIAAERGRKTRPEIHLGVCGEHGGDPASIEFVDGVGLDYVSCSPYRVPIARLAAAQAAIKHDKK